MTTYSVYELTRCLRSLGVNKGDCLFVHSALKSVGKLRIDESDNMLDRLLTTMISAVGCGGTIVVPTFNYEFSMTGVFNVQETPGDGMGAFSEFVRKSPNAHRTRHPFHSIAAVGKHASSIAGATGFSEFSDGSAFDLLLKLECKIIFFGVEFVTTFLHIAEEREKVPYRFWKKFHGSVVSGNEEEDVTMNFYARQLDAKPEPTIDIDRISSYLRSCGVIRSQPLGAGTVSICSGRQLVGKIREKLTHDPQFLLTEPYE